MILVILLLLLFFIFISIKNEPFSSSILYPYNKEKTCPFATSGEQVSRDIEHKIAASFPFTSYLSGEAFVKSMNEQQRNDEYRLISFCRETSDTTVITLYSIYSKRAYQFKCRVETDERGAIQTIHVKGISWPATVRSIESTDYSLQKNTLLNWLKDKKDYIHQRSYLCYDAFRSFSERQKCEKYGYVWDRPCRKNTDCPFYKANTNYENSRGGCLPSGFCELPVNMKNTSYTKYDPSFQPYCYNCPSSTTYECCHEQTSKTGRSPDYAFANDFEERYFHKDQLKARNLRVSYFT